MNDHKNGAGRARSSSVERIAETLELKIAAREFEPGAKLGEEEMASSVASSRGALREALRILEGRGLVRRTPNAGVRVVELTREDAQHLYGLRKVLETAACEFAAYSFTSEDMARLDALLEKHARRPEVRSGENYRQTYGGDDFHYVIAERCGNPYLTRLLCHDLYSLIRLVRFHISATPGRAEYALADHKAIASAIRRRDGELAALLMDRHLSWAVDILGRSDQPWFFQSTAELQGVGGI